MSSADVSHIAMHLTVALCANLLSVFLHCISGKVHKNLQHHLKGNGAIPREHGYCGRLPPNAFSFSTINRKSPSSQTMPLSMAYLNQRQELHLPFSVQLRGTTLFTRGTCRHVQMRGNRQQSTMHSVPSG